MSLFVDRRILKEREWGSLFLETAKQLRSLNHIKDKNYSDLADRCFSAAVAEDREESYMRINGVKITQGNRCIQRLNGKRCTGGCGACTPPGNDHGKLWIKDGEPYSYTFEPYHLRKEDVRELVEFCDEHGFDFDITNHSFHFPAGTTFVEITKKEI